MGIIALIKPKPTISVREPSVALQRRLFLSKSIQHQSISAHQLLFQLRFFIYQLIFLLVLLAVLLDRIAQDDEGTQEARNAGDEDHGQPDKGYVICSDFGGWLAVGWSNAHQENSYTT